MYEPQLWIDPKVYPFLVQWCVSTGYEVKTNDPHTLLYGLCNLDPIRGRELRAEGKNMCLSREEAESLVNDLVRHIEAGGEIFTPDYNPPIRLLDDFSVNVFLPAVVKEDAVSVDWEQWGIYHQINKVISQGEVLDRNHVMEMIRGLEYNAAMCPFAVSYNILKDRGSTSITWTSQKLQDYGEAQAVLSREKARHFPRDWRIYQNVTDIARHEEFLHENYVRCEGWLWFRVFHPEKEYSNEGYWEQGFFNDLGDLKSELIQIEENDMYAICGIYACMYHEPLPEEVAPAVQITNAKDLSDRRHLSDVQEWELMYRVLKPAGKTGYEGECEEVAYGYCDCEGVLTQEEALEKITAEVKDHLQRPPFMVILYRMEKIEEIGG